MNQAPVNFGLDVHMLYEANQFDLTVKAKTDRDIRVTFDRIRRELGQKDDVMLLCDLEGE